MACPFHGFSSSFSFLFSLCADKTYNSANVEFIFTKHFFSKYIIGSFFFIDYDELISFGFEPPLTTFPSFSLSAFKFFPGIGFAFIVFWLGGLLTWLKFSFELLIDFVYLEIDLLRIAVGGTPFGFVPFLVEIVDLFSFVLSYLSKMFYKSFAIAGLFVFAILLKTSRPIFYATISKTCSPRFLICLFLSLKHLIMPFG